MRKLRRAVLRNEANRLSRHGRNGKSIAIFRSLWDDYKELKQHKELARKARRSERGSKAAPGSIRAGVLRQVRRRNRGRREHRAGKDRGGTGSL